MYLFKDADSSRVEKTVEAQRAESELILDFWSFKYTSYNICNF